MKFESLMLNSLFTACLLICVLTMGAMVTAKPAAQHIAAAHAHVAAKVGTAA
jgi:hypothetical protein